MARATTGDVPAIHALEEADADFVRAELVMRRLLTQMHRSRGVAHRLHRVFRGCQWCDPRASPSNPDGVGACPHCHRPCLDVT
jgi:hypothetical protein